MMENEIAKHLSFFCYNKHIKPPQQFTFSSKSNCEMVLIH